MLKHFTPLEDVDKTWEEWAGGGGGGNTSSLTIFVFFEGNVIHARSIYMLFCLLT